MKKSKIIVPALALLLLSTAATVSGSVAWFTANRTFDTNIADFEVVNTEGNLAVDMGSGLGTTAEDDKQSVSINSGVKLGDASFNHTSESGHLFTDTAVEGQYKDLGAYNDASVATKWLISGKTYYAITWTMEFKYTFAADLTEQNLYLNKTSTMAEGAETKAADSSDKKAALGFRIAFFGTDANTTQKVWSGLQTAAKMTNYVASTSATGAYSGDAISTATTGGTADSNLVLENAATGDRTKANYLGYFTGSEGATVSLHYTCVAWFEGTDENVISAAQFKKVTANMKFFVKPHQA